MLTAILAGSVLTRQLYMLGVDGELRKPAAWRRLLRFDLGRDENGARGVLPLLLRDYLQYLRPGFHPWDEDDRYLIEAWVAAHARGEPMLSVDLAQLFGELPVTQAA